MKSAVTTPFPSRDRPAGGLTVVLVSALCSFFTVQAAKDVNTKQWTNWQKLAGVLLTALGVSASFHPKEPRKLGVYGIAGAGLAVVIHRFARLASVAGDQQIFEAARGRHR